MNQAYIGILCQDSFLIYELVGIRDGSDETQASATDQELCNLTTEAYELYAMGEYVAAKQAYQSIVGRFDDGLSRIMVEKCDLKLNPSDLLPI